MAHPMLTSHLAPYFRFMPSGLKEQMVFQSCRVSPFSPHGDEGSQCLHQSADGEAKEGHSLLRVAWWYLQQQSQCSTAPVGL